MIFIPPLYYILLLYYYIKGGENFVCGSCNFLINITSNISQKVVGHGEKYQINFKKIVGKFTTENWRRNRISQGGKCSLSWEISHFCHRSVRWCRVSSEGREYIKYIEGPVSWIQSAELASFQVYLDGSNNYGPWCEHKQICVLYKRQFACGEK